jgi:hypothetical protein
MHHDLGNNDNFFAGSCQIAISGPGDEFVEIHVGSYIAA